MERFLGRLKEVHADADTTDFTVLDFLGPFGSPFEAILYSHLFWPRFVEYRGMIFLESVIETEEDRCLIQDALERTGDKRGVEKSFNQFSIPSSFFNAKTSSTNEEEDLHLALVLAEMWGFRLKRLFPNRKFEIEVIPGKEGGDEPTIFVFERDSKEP